MNWNFNIVFPIKRFQSSYQLSPAFFVWQGMSDIYGHTHYQWDFDTVVSTMMFKIYNAKFAYNIFEVMKYGVICKLRRWSLFNECYWCWTGLFAETIIFMSVLIEIGISPWLIYVATNRCSMTLTGIPKIPYSLCTMRIVRIFSHAVWYTSIHWYLPSHSTSIGTIIPQHSETRLNTDRNKCIIYARQVPPDL